jgi:muramoyltetrapeptide carboxypeptidase
MLTPQPLKPGDKIGLIAPSRKVTYNDLAEPVGLLQSWGYQIAFGKNLYASLNQFAGTDAERAADFMDMITDPSVKAILCVRGGYGTARIFESLDADIVRQNPKWIIGYSDITVLHSYFHTVIGLESLHATMPINYKKGSDTSETWIMLGDVLSGKPLEYHITSHSLNRAGIAEGILVGGNLSVLFSLRGTFCDLDLDGKILFIEDLDEYLYHIDRMMMNLKLGGKLKSLKGLVIGGMSDMKDNAVPFGKTAFEIVNDAVSEYNFPVLFNFPAGHTEPNLPLILGRKVILSVTPDAALIKF